MRRHVDPAHVGRTLTHKHAAQRQHCLACKGRGRARRTQRHAQHGQAHVFHLVARLETDGVGLEVKELADATAHPI